MDLNFVHTIIDLTRNSDPNEEIIKSIFYVYCWNNRATELIEYFTEKEIEENSMIF